MGCCGAEPPCSLGTAVGAGGSCPRVAGRGAMPPLWEKQCRCPWPRTPGLALWPRWVSGRPDKATLFSATDPALCGDGCFPGWVAFSLSFCANVCTTSAPFTALKPLFPPGLCLKAANKGFSATVNASSSSPPPGPQPPMMLQDL